MTKAKRQIEEDIKLVDLVIELLDARCPLSSRNPDIDSIANNKSRMILLNKADMADPDVTESWQVFFEEKGLNICCVDARNSGDMKQINSVVRKACAKKIERDRARGIKNRPVRAMVVGIPNVGKSTFINTFAKKAVAKTGNKPGVTKGKQWIRLSNTLELLDTPGILWPKFEDEKVGLNLALIGSINDNIIDTEELAGELIKILDESYPSAVKDFYGIGETGLEEIARVRGCLKSGGRLDTLKAANILLENFRNGKLGRISLETLRDGGFING